MIKIFLPLSLVVFFLYSVSCSQKFSIDRYALAIRHNIENSIIDSLNSLSVGNGEFAFTGLTMSTAGRLTMFISSGPDLGED